MPEAQDHFTGRHYDAEHSTGPLKSLNPTKRYLVADKKIIAGPDTEQIQQPARPSAQGLGVAYVWRSRDNRKGRHALAVSVDPRKHDATKGQRPSNTWNQTLRGVSKMLLRYPVWDVSYDVAVVFSIGFLACSAQTFGATVFWISGFTALPPILNSLSTPAENGVYWLPQVIGGTGFIVSSTLFMLEVQSCWYIPAPGVLGWHIGLWNLIGAIGFTLCGALGFGITQPGVEYALTLSTFIGSWAFLIGSVIQWLESLNKYPIWVDEKVGRLERQTG
ncbi:hypothetical protein Forpi1262_v009478 [Fusarium oxysporum f. sp. raphani]|uniref:Integral membrane protein n=1 Tax=Fusarium oxysporum f. sp. raphani TaxID=96318 RepID=A0A8J5PUQ1_FUSOX|nr:hypothetical protein Forpi1262_v009478 [Fusarium oxysporum f. sp. raphani]